MAKRKTKAEGQALGLLLIVGVIVAGIGKLLDSIGVAAVLIICVAGIGALIWHNKAKREKRLEYLRNKHRDEATVQRILQHNFWEGQTSAQLIDSLGNPPSIDKKALKTISREIWKYNHRGANRYGLRITLDDNVVVGWDHKS